MSTINTLLPVSTSVIAEIALVQDMNKAELIAYWKRLFGDEPTISSTPLMKRRIAHQLQINGLKPKHKKMHEDNSKRLAGLMHQQKSAKTNKIELEPGTVLTRFYDGQEHVVNISMAGEILYKGIPYESLSAVAREITGTRWSGPVFFGLKGKKTKSKGGKK